MIRNFLQRAAAGKPIYIPDVRRAFQAEGTRPFHIHVTLYDRSVRVFPLALPCPDSEIETNFLTEYLHAQLYNILSALGALRVEIYLDRGDRELLRLAEGLPRVFQAGLAKSDRSGLGKCLNVNDRVLAALFQGRERFSFRVLELRDEPPVSAAPPAAGQPIFSRLPCRTREKLILGMDIGGTDIKLAVSVDGKLALCMEFDWFPAAYTRAEELTGPLLLLVRLTRAAGSLFRAGREEEVDRSLLRPGVSLSRLEQGAAEMERAAGADLRPFDAIGLCFPDVVIQNRIVGGETPKTGGMRRNRQLDYEAQFARISALSDSLAAYIKPGGRAMIINDGPMAAFTAAVEQGAAGADLSRGFFAHTLGTDLGSGWVRPDGSIPDIPLEIYNFMIDLGSHPQRGFDPDDIRSVRSFNSGLPGALQKYTGQSGVFRLGAERLPSEDPALFQSLLDQELFRWEDGRLVVPTSPRDMRKDCLAFFMEQAAHPGHPACQEIFRQIGEYLAVTWKETDYILQPQTYARTLFGRLVKLPACFNLIREGAARREPSLELLAADNTLANTPLMRQLAAHPDYTVAQFAQAVGAIYYGCLGL